MSAPVSLMEFVKLLLHDDAERARFATDPDHTLSQHGLGDLSPADVHDAVLLVQDTLTVDWSQAYGTGADIPQPGPVDHVPDHAPHIESPDWWTVDDPQPSVEHDQPVIPHAVDEALYDAPDLHFGH